MWEKRARCSKTGCQGTKAQGSEGRALCTDQVGVPEVQWLEVRPEGDRVPALEALTPGQRVTLSPIDKRKGNRFLNRGVTISRGSCLEAQVSPGFN